jgi:hypothetical protein
MTCESPLQQKPKSVTRGQKSIKKCTHCKRYDLSTNLGYNKRNAFYYHRTCNTITVKISNKTKTQLDPAVKFKQRRHPDIGKCFCCKGYDLKNNFNRGNQRVHVECNKVAGNNRTKMNPHKTDTCAFTGLPFGANSEMRPVGDHDHDTLLYRGHIWSAANRLEGAAKFIMNEAGWTVDELCDALKSYLAKPGIDIGLEPYPQLGFPTFEEAQQHYGC